MLSLAISFLIIPVVKTHKHKNDILLKYAFKNITTYLESAINKKNQSSKTIILIVYVIECEHYNPTIQSKTNCLYKRDTRTKCLFMRIQLASQQVEHLDVTTRTDLYS